MSDLLQIGSSALMAYQGALATAGHNIANVNTPGYTRQRVELSAVAGASMGNGYIGAGVRQATVARLGDGFASLRLQSDASAVGREEVLATAANRVDQLLSDSASGLSSALSGFYSAVDALAATPSDTAARSALLGTAESLAARFNALDRSFGQMQADISGRLEQNVTDINALSRTIANLNDRIALARGAAGGQPPNDLLDQRDQAIEQLAGKIGISTALQDDGSINVFAGSGQALVLGQAATALSTAPADGDSRGQLEIYYGSGAGAVRITGQVQGGAMGGLLDAQRQVLDPVSAKLGRIAVAVSSAFNALHAQGVDLNGALGGEFFSGVSPTLQAYSGNTGSATISGGYSDVAALTGEDYVLRYNSSGWELNSASGASVALSGSGTAADPLVGAGLSFVVSGSAAAGDRYAVQGTRAAAGQLQVAITDPAAIAAAAPVRVERSLGNSGNASAGAVQVLDAGDPALRNAVTIQFTSASSYTVDGNGPFAYTSGGAIAANGWSLTLSGTAAAGDSFRVLPVGANSGDNRAALGLAGLRSKGLLDGGTSSAAESYASLVGQAGSLSQQAQLRQQAQTALQTYDRSERDAASGVNLDEEAADLVRFQNAYQAAAQVIATANSMFSTLMSALRG